MEITHTQLQELCTLLPAAIKKARDNNTYRDIFQFSGGTVELWFTGSGEYNSPDVFNVRVFVEHYILLSGKVDDVYTQLHPECRRETVERMIEKLLEDRVGELAYSLTDAIRNAPKGKPTEINPSVRLHNWSETITLDYNNDRVISLRKSYYPDWIQLVAVGTARVLIDLNSKLGKYTIPANSGKHCFPQRQF